MSTTANLAHALVVVVDALPDLSEYHAHLIALTVAAVANRTASPDDAISDLVARLGEPRSNPQVHPVATLRLVR